MDAVGTTSAENSLPPLYKHDGINVGGVTLHYVTGGRPLGTAPVLLLIHGFPQNWWSWRKIMPALGERFTVVAPDLRGIGLSDRPPDGYSKKQLASDLHAVVESLNAGPAHVVGHDIGGMVAYAYAWQFPLRSLAILDVSLPGVGDWDQVANDPIIWHFAFHQKRDLPEALICGGRERAYISAFMNPQAHIRGAVSATDMDEYVRAYSHPGAFRAALEMYRQFPQDVLDNRKAGRLPPELKVLAIGAETRWGLRMGQRLSAVSDNVQSRSIPNCGHYLAEEQPELLVDSLLEFLH